ncbi:8-oxo-dGTP diphosphatase [Paraburkholderia kururiensis]|uniref:NUDIX hydrolase n=1 Tax=Paraburkholderia kururiensis TaxID=984307 RepID=UPI0039A53E00
MKERATVICERGSCILLVGKAGARWNLPGGKLKPDETIRQAASRELLEETHLDAVELHYLFAFVGTRTRHHVFLARLPDDPAPAPGREIARCGWFDIARLARLRTSTAVKVIVGMLALSRRSGLRGDQDGETASDANAVPRKPAASRATLSAAP